MSLSQWANNGRLRPHQTSPTEIQDLLAIVTRDLADAESDISADGRNGGASIRHISCPEVDAIVQRPGRVGALARCIHRRIQA